MLFRRQGDTGPWHIDAGRDDFEGYVSLCGRGELRGMVDLVTFAAELPADAVVCPECLLTEYRMTGD